MKQLTKTEVLENVMEQIAGNDLDLDDAIVVCRGILDHQCDFLEVIAEAHDISADVEAKTREHILNAMGELEKAIKAFRS